LLNTLLAAIIITIEETDNKQQTTDIITEKRNFEKAQPERFRLISLKKQQIAKPSIIKCTRLYMLRLRNKLWAPRIGSSRKGS